VECSPAYLQKKRIFGCSRARAPISAWGKRGRPLLEVNRKLSPYVPATTLQPAMEHEQMPPFQNLTYDFHLVSSAGFSRQLATRPTQGIGIKIWAAGATKAKNGRGVAPRSSTLLHLLMPIGYRVRPFHDCAFSQPCLNELEQAPNAVTPSVMPCKL
jgi:hypothetical protein